MRVPQSGPQPTPATRVTWREGTRAALARVRSKADPAADDEPAVSPAPAARGGRRRAALAGVTDWLAADSLVPLTATACGQSGGYYFQNDPSWVVRHVETLEMQGLRSAERRLTIDLALPLEPGAIVATEGELRLYCVPIARLSKERPTGFIDLRDEAGRALPLLTLQENARISSLALQSAVRGAIGLSSTSPLPEQATLAADGLPVARRPVADYWAVIFNAAVADLAGEHGAAVPERLGQVVTQLVENSYLWTVISGRPGDRRILKLRYSIELDRPNIPVRADMLVPFTDLALEVSVPEGRILWGRTLAVSRALAAAMLGWDSIDLTLPDPVMQDPRTYHLQVDPPHGLRVDRIELDPGVGDPMIAQDTIYVRKGHFYLMPARVERAVPLSISMRVVRRGFLNLSMLTATIICGALWAYHSSVKEITSSLDHGTSAAAVLLVTPALLVLFATRPSEHPLASMLLSGLRSVMFLCGLIAGAAAAAIAGVKPTHSLATSLLLYAILASICAAVIAIAYLDSWPRVRQIAERARQWWCSAPCGRPRAFFAIAATAAVLLALAVAAHAHWLRAYPHPTRVAILALLIGVVAGYQCVRRVGRSPEERVVPHGVRLLALATVLVALASADPGGPHAVALDRQSMWFIARLAAFAIVAWGLFTWFALWLAPIRVLGSHLAPDVEEQPLPVAGEAAMPGSEARPAGSEKPQHNPTVGPQDSRQVEGESST